MGLIWHLPAVEIESVKLMIRRQTKKKKQRSLTIGIQQRIAPNKEATKQATGKLKSMKY